MDCGKQGCYDTGRGIFMNPVANNIESCLSRQQQGRSPITQPQQTHSKKHRKRSYASQICFLQTNSYFFSLGAYFPEGQCFDCFKGMIPWGSSMGLSIPTKVKKAKGVTGPKHPRDPSVTRMVPQSSRTRKAPIPGIFHSVQMTPRTLQAQPLRGTGISGDWQRCSPRKLPVLLMG